MNIGCGSSVRDLYWNIFLSNSTIWTFRWLLQLTTYHEISHFSMSPQVEFHTKNTEQQAYTYHTRTCQILCWYKTRNIKEQYTCLIPPCCRSLSYSTHNLLTCCFNYPDRNVPSHISFRKNVQKKTIQIKIQGINSEVTAFTMNFCIQQFLFVRDNASLITTLIHCDETSFIIKEYTLLHVPFR
jgi:hypothetical protein